MRIILIYLLGVIGAHAQLVVTVSPPKTIGGKALVRLGMKNGLAEKIESARAACFVLGEQAKGTKLAAKVTFDRVVFDGGKLGRREFRGRFNFG